MTTMEAEPRRAEPEVPPSVTAGAPPRRAPRGGRRWIVVLPAVAALGGYGLHAVLRLIDATAVSDLYPKALLATLAAAIIFAVVASLSARFRPSALHVAPLFAAAIIVVAIWDLMTALLVVDVAGGPKLPLLPMPYFPSPELVLQGLVDDRWMLLESAYYSFRLLLSGYAVGVLAGLTTGVLMGWFKQVRYWGMPILKFVGPIPATAFIPLAMIIFDEPFFSGVALIALAVWFPVTMLTTSGIANVPASYFDVARTLGAGRRFLVFRVAIPAAMPSMFIGLFMGMGAAFLTLIVAETVGVRAGLGWYFKLQKDYFEFGKVYASLLIMAVFFSGLMTLLFKIRDRVLGWQKGVIRW